MKNSENLSFAGDFCGFFFGDAFFSDFGRGVADCRGNDESGFCGSLSEVSSEDSSELSAHQMPVRGIFGGLLPADPIGAND